MEITKNFLKRHNACSPGYEWFISKYPNASVDVADVTDDLLAADKFEWANWLVVECLKTKKKQVQYAVFAAGLVLPIFEKKFPDKGPRESIRVTKKYINSQSSKNKQAAAHAAKAAAYAASHASHASPHAAKAAYAAAHAAHAAHATAYNAPNGAHAAAAASYAAAAAAETKKLTQKRIIEYGLSLIS
jgi:hypothetical protein